MSLSLPLPEAHHWLIPDWQPHARVQACVTTRLGDYSPAPWAGFNLGLNCQDETTRVLTARQHVKHTLQLKRIGWLTQVHGTHVVSAPQTPCEADASISNTANQACAILTADCLPVLFARTDGSAVAAAHAGWQGLAAGILGRTVEQLAPQGEAVAAWLGPAICQACYQVDAKVHNAFLAEDAASAAAFEVDGVDHYRLSLKTAARLQLEAKGISVTESPWCTACHNHRFYSYRKEHQQTGRFASLVWLSDS